MSSHKSNTAKPCEVRNSNSFPTNPIHLPFQHLWFPKNQSLKMKTIPTAKVLSITSDKTSRLVLFVLDNRERMALPEAPTVQEFDPLRTENNEEFVARLKNMGKSNRFPSQEMIFSHISFDRFHGQIQSISSTIFHAKRFSFKSWKIF